MRTWTLGLLVLAGGLLAFLGNPVALAQDAKYEVVYLDQGWTKDERQQYYRTSQGSALLSYDFFLNLEEAKSEHLFRADENMVRYGLVPQPADPKVNPDALPIGWTKTVVTEGRWKGDWAGISCAACHNGQLEYKGNKIRIDGGVNLTFDLYAFVRGLDDAIGAAVADSKKFDRLADKLARRDAAGKAELRKRLETETVYLHRVRKGYVSSTDVGPGRMDAITLVHNQVVSNELGIPENWIAASAPVKWPFLWNAPQSAWVGWRGTQQFPLLRNAGESMGVWVKTDLTSKTPAEGLFDSTLDLKGQILIESLLRKLAPPTWPEDILGKIDQKKVAQGSELYAQHCASCHSQWPHRWSDPKKQGKRFIENALVPVDFLGTDAAQVDNLRYGSNPTMMAGRLSEFLAAPFKGKEVAPALGVLGPAMVGTMNKELSRLAISNDELEAASGYRLESEPTPPNGLYKAAPRDGTWAIPPYLHNNSVPNLYELLIPAKERSKKFFVGAEFDPVKVGVDTSEKPGKFLFDTSLYGNSNSGHSFESGPLGRGVIGPLLTEEERWALVEYLKSIPNAPGQVAPFGGPKDAVLASQDKSFFHNNVKGGYQVAQAGIPVQPSPGLGEETVKPNEPELIDKIVNAIIERLRVQFPAGTPVLRDAHPKTHGVVRAEFIVLDDLPNELRHGVFKAPHTFDALIRFSASGSAVRADTIREARGMAIKLLGVDGKKILDAEQDARTQDFVMINFPVFFISSLEDYIDFASAQAGGKLDEFWKAHPEAFKINKEAAATEFHNPLRGQFFSEEPYKLGPHAIKFSARPISMTTIAKPDNPGPEYLREAMLKQLKEGDAYFEFVVQLQTDALKMPIEDSAVIWDEALSPFQRVALIRIPKQDPTAFKDLEFGEQLSFTPWHALPEHRPLGAINRARRVAYDAISRYRHEQNKEPRREPTELPK
jgi:hypothetical protein